MCQVRCYRWVTRLLSALHPPTSVGLFLPSHSVSLPMFMPLPSFRLIHRLRPCSCLYLPSAASIVFAHVCSASTHSLVLVPSFSRARPFVSFGAYLRRFVTSLIVDHVFIVACFSCRPPCGVILRPTRRVLHVVSSPSRRPSCFASTSLSLETGIQFTVL